MIARMGLKGLLRDIVRKNAPKNRVIPFAFLLIKNFVKKEIDCSFQSLRSSYINMIDESKMRRFKKRLFDLSLYNT